MKLTRLFGVWVDDYSIQYRLQLRFNNFLRFFDILLATPAALMMAEPLVMAQQPQAFTLISEMLPAFAASADAAACPRLRPRKGQRLGGTTSQALVLSFARWSGNYYAVSGGNATTLRSKADAADHAAVCAWHVMTAGRHAAEFAVGKVSDVMLGLARPGVDVNEKRAWRTDEFVGISDAAGYIYTEDDFHHWDGQKSFKQGDVVRLLLDCDAGTLSVKKNGERLGVARTGLTGEWCWAAAMDGTAGASEIRIAAADAGAF